MTDRRRDQAHKLPPDFLQIPLVQADAQHPPVHHEVRPKIGLAQHMSVLEERKGRDGILRAKGRTPFTQESICHLAAVDNRFDQA